MRLLVTGGAGFIGSNFVRHMLDNYDYEIVVLDALTYSGNRNNLPNHPNLFFYHGDIRNPEAVNNLMQNCQAVVHFAAESHVDRSIQDATPFVSTNVLGTQVLLDAAVKHNISKFVHISTDEVYGSVDENMRILDETFTESSMLNPTSPYASSKASSDLIVQSYHKTFGLNTIITRSSNNYGQYQYPEKFIPLMITNAFMGKKLPLYGTGDNRREWIHVEDNCRAIDKVLHEGTVGDIYNISTEVGSSNRDILYMILAIMDKPEDMIENVTDRLAHDFEYAVATEKIFNDTGWSPTITIDDGMVQTINWYLDNVNWWENLKK